VDKLNAYTTFGNVLRASRESDLGTLRTGLWIDRADSHRYQIKSDPRTWVDVSAPNFSESYTTTTIQPYVEHEFKLNDKLKFTPGLKYASYTQDFTHLQDNGGAVGFLGGTLTKNALTGGAASISNSITYTDWLPSLDLHYAIQPNWTAYAQYAYGDQIPDTGVFDVTNAAPAVTPKPILAKTLQVGTVWNTSSMTLSGDVYHTQLDSTYTGVLNATTGVTSWTPSGTQINQGLEGEANFALGGGFSVYTNATLGSLKYDSGIFAGKWVSGAPRDTEALGLNYQRDGWAANLQVKRIGEMYNDGKLNAPDANNNTAKPEGFTIDPVVVSNLFVNYTVKTPNSFAKSAKISLGVSNLFDKHSVVGIAGVTAGSTSANPSAADLLTVLAGRSINLSATLSF
jgi:iron complex outermembrane receptor protein